MYIHGGRFFMNIQTKFCSMSTKTATIHLMLFHSERFFFADLCDIFIVPNNDNLPTLRLFYSVGNGEMYIFSPKKMLRLLRVSSFSCAEHLPLELELLIHEKEPISLSELKQLVIEAIQHKEYWKDIVVPAEEHKNLSPDFPNVDYIMEIEEI